MKLKDTKSIKDVVKVRNNCKLKAVNDRTSSMETKVEV
jgi:hypothetical protein